MATDTQGLRMLSGGLLGFGLAASGPQVSGWQAFLLSPAGLVVTVLMVHVLVSALTDVFAPTSPMAGLVLGGAGLGSSLATAAAIMWGWTLGAPTVGLGAFAVICVVLAAVPLAQATYRDWALARACVAQLRSRATHTTF